MQPLEAHIHAYTYFVYGESGLLGGGDNGMARRHLHVRAYSRYTRYALCHDHPLVEIVIGGFAETHLRFGKDYKCGKPF